jgi:tetraacyldisaccharide 4'-kinase
VARARLPGAAKAVAAGASVIVMDDGFQNPSLAKDVSVLVVDERRGLGNGRVFPAGPLRAPLSTQLDLAHAIVLVGRPSCAGVSCAGVLMARASHVPVFRAKLEPDQTAVAAMRRGRVLAFAGIADPGKFFATLARAGIEVAAECAFPDHHRYTREQAERLCDQADHEGLMLVTTEKDMARMRGTPELLQLAEKAHVLPVTMTFDDEATFRSILLERLAAARPVAHST